MSMFVLRHEDRAEFVGKLEGVGEMAMMVADQVREAEGAIDEQQYRMFFHLGFELNMLREILEQSEVKHLSLFTEATDESTANETKD